MDTQKSLLVKKNHNIPKVNFTVPRSFSLVGFVNRKVFHDEADIIANRQ